MTLMLGIDTGGTFTDAVLLDAAIDPSGGAARQVVAHAKSPTTHHDLTIGVAGAIDRVLTLAGSRSVGEIGLVSVSTTLATNALVEGHGEPAGLVTFGFTSSELERSGIAAAVDRDLLITLDGGHDAHGNERAPLDAAAVEAAARALAPRVTAFAVAAQFSVRNPEHEHTAVEIIRAATGRPVTASHVLSAKLDGPRRALTAALNARLIGTIDRLNQAVRSVLVMRRIDAPVMVVRGDGSLVSAAFAGERPIETVLSGPAASVIGALHLADMRNGLVSDIGGTTTDVAVITDGRPSVTGRGAVVGGHRTMVEAVEMATTGLGGDSELRVDARAERGPLLLGPGRAIPLCRLAIDNPQIHVELDRQLAAPMGLTTHGRFLVAVGPADQGGGDDREREVLERLGDGPLAVNEAAPSGLAMQAAKRLQARGLVRISTLTPTDATAVVGSLEGVDREAAAKGAAILARQTGSNGAPLAGDGIELASRVLDLLARNSAEFMLRTALGADGVETADNDLLVEASLRGHRGVAAISVSLPNPITAIGAPAAAYYHRVADLAGTTAVVPQFAEVANAVGAVVGQVRVRQSATVTQPTRGQFRVHLQDQPTFGSVDNARAAAALLLEAAATELAVEAGAETTELTSTWQERTATIEGRDVFVEGTLTVEAAGRPRFVTTG